MGIGSIATRIAIVILPAFFLLPPTAKPDSFHVTGQTDYALCASRGYTCFATSYSLDITTDSLQISPPARSVKSYNVLAVSGEIDGQAVSEGSGQLMTSQLSLPDWPAVPWSNVDMISGGYLVSFIGGPDSTSGLTDVRIVTDPQGTVNWATWNAVTTPEASTLLFLGIGLMAVMGLTLLKNRLN